MIFAPHWPASSFPLPFSCQSDEDADAEDDAEMPAAEGGELGEGNSDEVVMVGGVGRDVHRAMMAGVQSSGRRSHLRPGRRGGRVGRPSRQPTRREPGPRSRTSRGGSRRAGPTRSSSASSRGSATSAGSSLPGPSTSSVQASSAPASQASAAGADAGEDLDALETDLVAARYRNTTPAFPRRNFVDYPDVPATVFTDLPMFVELAPTPATTDGAVSRPTYILVKDMKEIRELVLNLIKQKKTKFVSQLSLWHQFLLTTRNFDT